MKRLATLLALAPSVTLAHGGHAHLPETVHTSFHAAPVLIAVTFIALAVLVWRARE